MNRKPHPPEGSEGHSPARSLESPPASFPARPQAGLDDDALLEAVARAATRYFWEGAHPISGLALERSAGDFGYDIAETTTAGGTGFGLMALIAAQARGWIGRRALVHRLREVLGFLEGAERWDGVFPHFLHGTTGRVIPFSPTDDGGDIVETAFLAMGLIAVREAFADDPKIAEPADRIWREIDWRSHLRNGTWGLMWHRSPDRAWTAQSLPVHGWNEALVAYVLAAGAPLNGIDPAHYHEGWARGAEFATGQTRHGVRLPLGPPGGGPMFLSHYSFLGLDPRGLVDRYADYHAQVCAHAAVNRAHCIANPHGHAGYGPACWGLTASDSPGGYAAHEPSHDLGVISPTAAVASLPFCPEASIAALRHFVDERGLWGPFGLPDAFCPATGWVAQATLAIDQGPIAVMIENHRSGLLWRLVMGAREVQEGLRRLGFTSPHLR